MEFGGSGGNLGEIGSMASIEPYEIAITVFLPFFKITIETVPIWDIIK